MLHYHFGFIFALFSDLLRKKVKFKMVDLRFDGTVRYDVTWFHDQQKIISSCKVSHGILIKHKTNGKISIHFSPPMYHKEV